jgi:hypothetical protein
MQETESKASKNPELQKGCRMEKIVRRVKKSPNCKKNHKKKQK